MKLSEFKDEKAVEVVAKLLVPIGNIATDKEMAEAQRTARHMGEFASFALQKHARDVLDMLAHLNGQDPEDFHCSAATVMRDVMNMFSDPELMALFGLQRQNPASSGSASENTGAAAAQKPSSATQPRKSSGSRRKKRTRHT